MAQAYVKIYACPSDANPPPTQSYYFTLGTDWFGRGQFANYSTLNARRGNYYFSTGMGQDYSSTWNASGPDSDGLPTGAFGTNSKCKITDIKDGSSNTWAIGEATQQHGGGQRTQNGQPSKDGYIQYGPRPLEGSHVGQYGISHQDPFFSTVFAVNAPWDSLYGDPPAYPCPNINNCTGFSTFGSLHPGGAQFVYCDGSVHFVPNSTPPVIQNCLSYINDGNMINGQLVNMGGAP